MDDAVACPLEDLFGEKLLGSKNCIFALIELRELCALSF